MKRILLLTLCATLVLGGCGATNKGTKAEGALPDWVLDVPQRSGYLYGSGSAEIYAGADEALERAKDVALANLLKQLELRIEGSLQSTETLKQQSGKEEQLIREVEQQVRTRIPEFRLRHTSLVDQYVAKKARRVYALMRLDLAQERQTLAREIALADTELERGAVQLPSLDPREITHLRKLSALLVKLEQRGELQRQLNRLSPGQSQPLLSEPQQGLRERIYTIFASLRVTLASGGAGNGGVAAILAEELTKRGLLLGSGRGDFALVYNIRVDTTRRDDLTFGFTEGAVQIQDRHGSVVSSVNAKAKGVSTDATLAKRRAIAKVGQRLAEAVINAFFEG